GERARPRPPQAPALRREGGQRPHLAGATAGGASRDRDASGQLADRHSLLLPVGDSWPGGNAGVSPTGGGGGAAAGAGRRPRGSRGTAATAGCGGAATGCQSLGLRDTNPAGPAAAPPATGNQATAAEARHSHRRWPSIRI